MVDDPEIKLPKTGLPRLEHGGRRGPKPKPGRTKDARLMLRVHPDVEALVKKRCDEAGENQSRYIERILIGWLNADPRNYRLDANGIRIPNMVSPEEQKARDPYKFAERWQKFAAAHTIIKGAPPPQAWVDEFAAQSPFTDGEFDFEPAPGQDDPPPPEVAAWLARKLKR
ncbi:MAG: hypothetical protein Q7T73_15375 [Beijerinckiaceae bacterium]|nr:hypothetical protein [Beijerinckiaceae bacterium]